MISEVRKVKTTGECCTGSSIVLCLFRPEQSTLVRGWYIGPLQQMEGGSIHLHFLPKAAAVLGPVAVLRSAQLARALGIELVVYDPDDLLEEAWIG